MSVSVCVSVCVSVSVCECVCECEVVRADHPRQLSVFLTVLRTLDVHMHLFCFVSFSHVHTYVRNYPCV